MSMDETLLFQCIGIVVRGTFCIPWPILTVADIQRLIKLWQILCMLIFISKIY